MAIHKNFKVKNGIDATGDITGNTVNGISGLSSTLPIVDGSAAAGTGVAAARADHVHPTDTSRAPLASPTFTGTVSGISKSMVGLNNVDNTTDLNKPVSTAQQTALDTKVDKSIVNTDTAGAGILVGHTTKELTRGFTAFTGALQIELTGLYNEASMVGRMKVVINQAVGDDRVFYIDGRWLNTTHAWDEANVIEVTTASDKLPVRFAKSSDSAFLVIGETTTSWNALRVMIDEVVTNYNVSLDLGFVITSTTSLAGLTSDYTKVSVNSLYTDTEKSKLLGIENNAKDDQNASEVPVTPVGGIASTNVQAAIQELDSEKVAFTDAATVNLFRADKYLAAQSVANMLYTDGKLTKVRYIVDTDTDYEILDYNVEGKLESVAHYVATLLEGNTILSYTAGKLSSAIYSGV